MRRTLQGDPPRRRRARTCDRCRQQSARGLPADREALQPEAARDMSLGHMAGIEGMNILALFQYRRARTDQAVCGQVTTTIYPRAQDPYRSYLGKSFVIDDPYAIVRDQDGTPQRYAEGDEIPPGKSVGDIKIIPEGTIVSVVDVPADLRHVQVEGWGWTAIGNLQDGLYNETIGMDPAAYECEDPGHETVAIHDCAIRSNTPLFTYPRVEPRAIIPRGTRVHVLQWTSADHGNAKVALPGGALVWTRSANLSAQPGADGTFEATDPQALIRWQLVTYPATGGILPQGERVIVLAGSPDTGPVDRYVQVARTVVSETGERVRDEDRAPVWVESAALAHGWADFRGDNARWRKSSTDVLHGVYLGQMDVVRLIGRDTESNQQEVERISAAMLEQYDDLVAAAAADGHAIRLNSGFRTFAEQQALWDANPNPSQVARPGRSNHQNGIAIDINTGSFQSALYLWMKDHGPDHGFIRTVSGEHWHWEYRPADAAAHGYRLPSVNP
ncbi:MAG TPA: M15 family metallopeptidase [Haliangium sp.]|nr:M15 family metallopeptidase [Haliangium sp.]